MITNQMEKEAVDRCKKLIHELDLESGSKIILGFLNSSEDLDSLLKAILAFAMLAKMSKRTKEFKILSDAASTISIEKTLYNQFEDEMKTVSPRN